MGERAFLFLQGPPGPLFRRLGQAMAERGVRVHRININAGDEHDWPDGAVSFRGRFTEWPPFLDRFLTDNAITDLMLFGDCRPYHASAHGIAQWRGVRTHVLEEGYIRPDWMTLEPEGVNAHSTLSRDSNWFRREAENLPPEQELPPVTSSFRRRARDSFQYFSSLFLGAFLFPHYRSHRPTPILIEGFGWVWKYVRGKLWPGKSATALNGLQGRPMFLFPLQLSSDYQIRTHSLFPDMQSAATYVIESFAAHATADSVLVLKAHPLDPSFFNWPKFVARLARRLNVEGRLRFVDGGSLEEMLESSRGMICVNSTSATLALARGVPVCAVGNAIYDIPGLTHQGHLDQFWEAPTKPEPGLYEAFRRVLVDRCLVRGGLASESAVALLIRSILDRLKIPRASRETECAVGQAGHHAPAKGASWRRGLQSGPRGSRGNRRRRPASRSPSA